MIFFAICPKENENSNKPTICSFQTQKRKHFRWLFVKERGNYGKMWSHIRYTIKNEEFQLLKNRNPAVTLKKSSMYLFMVRKRWLMLIVTRYLGNRETKSTKQVKQSDSNVLLLFYLLRYISMELIFLQAVVSCSPFWRWITVTSFLTCNFKLLTSVMI